MATAVFLLCALTSLLCAALLLRAYRSAPTPLRLGALVCFAGLAVNNLLLVADEVVLGGGHWADWRGIPALVGLTTFLWTILWEQT